MAGRGPAPKPADERARRNPATRGEWATAPGVGWQHGPAPAPPAKLTKAARDAWETWMGSWFASFWAPEDLPALRQLIRLYDQVERGEFQRHSEMRIAMDCYGITPKGQQDRRWRPPVEDQGRTPRAAEGRSRYGHLRAVAPDGA